MITIFAIHSTFLFLGGKRKEEENNQSLTARSVYQKKLDNYGAHIILFAVIRFIKIYHILSDACKSFIYGLMS